MTKATTAPGDQLQYGPNWVLSKRATLKVFADRLECGAWTIPYTEVRGSTLYSIRSSFIIPGFVLRVTTDDTVYHFGLNPGSYWRGDLPFEVTRESGKMTYTPFSVAVRVVAVAAIIGLLWERLAR